MPPPLPYFKVNICPLVPFPPFASIVFAYLWSFRWPNYIVTLPRYFSFRMPHLNINTGAPSDELDKNIQEYNSYWYGGQYQDIQTAQGSWYGLVEMILPEPYRCITDKYPGSFTFSVVW
jgi:hypothetical protein